MSLQDDVLKLYRTGAKRIVLDDIPARPAIAAAVGVGGAIDSAGEPTGSVVLRKEAVTVWSSLIITEAGAFEKPPGWPSDGTYPGESFELEFGTPYYEQQRVHLVLYDVAGVMHEDRYLIQIAAPFSGAYQGITNLGSGWAPALFMSVAPGTLPQVIQDRIAELAFEGVS